jgi:hypothetical protein
MQFLPASSYDAPPIERGTRLKFASFDWLLVFRVNIFYIFFLALKYSFSRIYTSYCTVSAVLVGLQTTPLNWLQSFIADPTSRYYNHSFTLGSEPLDVLVRGGLLMSSRLEGWRLTDLTSPWLFFDCHLSSTDLLQSQSHIATGGRSVSQ